jgi:hypothetical protein
VGAGGSGDPCFNQHSLIVSAKISSYNASFKMEGKVADCGFFKSQTKVAWNLKPVAAESDVPAETLR